MCVCGIPSQADQSGSGMQGGCPCSLSLHVIPATNPGTPCHHPAGGLCCCGLTRWAGGRRNAHNPSQQPPFLAHSTLSEAGPGVISVASSSPPPADTHIAPGYQVQEQLLFLPMTDPGELRSQGGCRGGGRGRKADYKNQFLEKMQVEKVKAMPGGRRLIPKRGIT